MRSSLAPDVSISVVIPARNEERYVAGALASVCAQRWRGGRLEAIVVDNNSTDGTAEVVRAFSARAQTIDVRLVSCSRVGVAAAKNRGAAAARGAYLIFLDADSRMAATLAAHVASAARRGFPAGCIRIVADSRDWLDRGFFQLMEFGKELFDIQAQMFYCQRQLFGSLGGFDERLRVAEDRDFLIRCERAGAPLARIRRSYIATSPRRLHARRWRLGMLTMLCRWALANKGIGRRWQY